MHVFKGDDTHTHIDSGFLSFQVYILWDIDHKRDFANINTSFPYFKLN